MNPNKVAAAQAIMAVGRTHEMTALWTQGARPPAEVEELSRSFVASIDQIVGRSIRQLGEG